MKTWSQTLARLAGELKRRRVLQVTGFYVVAAWGASQGVAEILPLFGAPDWAVKAFVVVAFGLLPAVIALAWMFDITPTGIQRDRRSSDRQQAAGEQDGAADTVMRPKQDSGCVVVSWQEGKAQKHKSFTGDFTMGRGADCELRFPDPLISRRHARVAWRDGRWILTDLGSKNGTLMNGEKIATAELPSQCELRLDEAGALLHFRVIPPGRQADQETVARSTGGV